MREAAVVGTTAAFGEAHPYTRLARLGLSLILGGAIGNLIDRLRQGYVVDFVDIYWRNWHFWAFNVADAAITIGVALMILDMMGVASSSRDEFLNSEIYNWRENEGGAAALQAMLADNSSGSRRSSLEHPDAGWDVIRETLIEQGLKGANVDMWYALFAPKGTPANIVTRYGQALAAILGLLPNVGAQPISLQRALGLAMALPQPKTLAFTSATQQPAGSAFASTGAGAGPPQQPAAASPGAVKSPQPHPKLWGVEFPQPIASKAREFNKDEAKEKKRK